MYYNYLAASSRIHRIKRGLADETIQVSPENFPRFLYHNEAVLEADLFEGFLKGTLLVKVCSFPLTLDVTHHFAFQGYLHVMRGPSVAVSNGTEDLGNRKGNAALHGITSTNIHSITYIAVLPTKGRA